MHEVALLRPPNLRMLGPDDRAGERKKKSSGRISMQTRRDFVHGASSAAGAVAFVACELLSASHAHAEGAPRRREVVVSGKRVKTVDIHAHCAFPDVNALLGLKVAPAALNETERRIQQMDAQGIDVEALSINPFWYKADRDLFNPEALRYLASRVGVSQIMLGTDYPFPWAKGGATVDVILNTPGLSDDDKRAMLGGSAAKLLGISI
jgi:hypothetical protein